MHIVVCIKQIIDPEIPSAEFKIDFEARKAVEDQGEWVLNPYDGNALEVALQLKDRQKETKVTAITMGGESSQKALRYALGMGCDDAIWLRDDSFDTLDSHGTARVLALGIQKAGLPDLVICGRQAGDWDMGQVGLMTGEALGLPCVSLANNIEYVDDQLRLKRETDRGAEVVETRMPLLATITNDNLNQPRFLSVKGIMAAKRKEISIWSAQDLEIEEAIQPVIVIDELIVPSYEREVMFIDGEDGHEKAVNLAQHLIKMNLL
jgi:electron transfer flavoprotein beta subunit